MINRAKITVLLLADNYPGNSPAENAYIKSALERGGYVVRTVTVREVCCSFSYASNVYALHSNLLIVPACQYLPIETVDILRRFSESAGSVIFLGGPLYYHRIEYADKSMERGEFVEIELDNLLDAGFSIPKPYTREGIAPSYKTYNSKNVTEIRPSSGQSIFSGRIKLPHPIDVSIPCDTGVNSGYVTDSLARFIPICDCYGETSHSPDPTIRGRQNGRRGSFAFIELERTMGDGYEGKADYGKVDNTVIGSSIAAIGADCPLNEIEGADELLLSLVKRLKLGLFLMEGGVDGRVYYPGEEMTVGAQILNTTDDFTKVAVEITVEGDCETLRFTKEKIVCPRSISDVSFRVSADELASHCTKLCEDYAVSARLILDGEEIDRIDSTFALDRPMPIDDPDAFVRVEGDHFVLDGKPWYMAGINYWSTYSQAREKRHYWLGLFDRANYSPKTVEEDLAYIEEIGLNCLLTRIDIADIERSVHGVRDYVMRCKRHNLRTWIAFTEAFNSRTYSPLGVELLFDRIFLAGNPTVMTFDMEWESQSDLHSNRACIPEFHDEWQEWLIERYGSIDAAEEYYGAKLPRDIYGYVGYPQVDLKGSADIRRYVHDSTDRCWEKLMAHFRPLVKNQLVSYRHGGPCTDGPALAERFIDFTPLEIYGFAGYENDLYNEENHESAVGLCVSGSVIQRYETGGKPVIWAEYGYSVCGTKWSNGKMKYDHKNRCYYPADIKYQRTYNSYMLEVIEDAGCAGSAPWWWCGGFRYTEMADFGYMMPDGQFSESGSDYVRFCQRMVAKAGTPDTRDTLIVEGNVYDYPGGKIPFIKAVCIPAYRTARAEGKRFVVRTQYE